MRILDSSKLPRCEMKRIICHWSEGNYRANSTDLEHYHILIEGDGKVRFGDHSIADNVSTADGDYAAHTRGLNTGSIGVACCCMVGCNEKPFRPGSQPLTLEQWNIMCQVVADLCDFYSIPVGRKTVLGHGEVQELLGIRQNGKWDPMVWPWDLSATYRQVGDGLRSEVSTHLTGPGTIIPLAASFTEEVFPIPRATVVPAPDTLRLRSRLLSGNTALEAVADDHLELTHSSQRRHEVGLVQDALNALATLGGSYQVDLGDNQQFRGFYGPKTRQAVLNFERDFNLTTNGVIDAETVVALDDALSRIEQGINPIPAPAPSFIPAFANGYAPPVSSAGLLAPVDFALGDPSPGSRYRQAYTAADADPTRAKGDPSNCKALLKFPKAVYFEAKMAICADGSPRALQIDSPYGQTGTAFTYPRVAKGYFNAEHVPYIVLPGKTSERDFIKDFGIKPLDLGVVIADGQVTPAFYGEVGPTYRIGEASIQVHENLPVKFPWTTPAKNHVRNASVPGQILYVVFPGTAVTRTANMSPEEWLKATLTAAATRFTDWINSGGAA